MRNECAAEKWLAVELTQRVRVSAIELVMLELYSSRVQDFELLAAASKPATAHGASEPWAQPPWQRIGRFRAANRKGSQARAALMLTAALLLHVEQQEQVLAAGLSTVSILMV